MRIDSTCVPCQALRDHRDNSLLPSVPSPRRARGLGTARAIEKYRMPEVRDPLAFSPHWSASVPTSATTPRASARDAAGRKSPHPPGIQNRPAQCRLWRCRSNSLRNDSMPPKREQSATAFADKARSNSSGVVEDSASNRREDDRPILLESSGVFGKRCAMRIPRRIESGRTPGCRSARLPPFD